MNRVIHKGAIPFAMRVSRGVLLRAVAIAVAILFIMLARMTPGIHMPGMLYFAFGVMPYESMLENAGYWGLIALAFALMVGNACIIIHRDLYKNGGKYIAMTLPFPRRYVFYAYCLAGLLATLLLWVALLLIPILLYDTVARQCLAAAQATAEQHAIAALTPLPNIIRTNGLFLAFQRSDVLCLLLPPSLQEGLHSLLLLLSLGILPAYLMMGEGKGISKLLVILPIWAVLYGLATRLLGLEGMMEPRRLWWGVAQLVLGLGLMLFRSIRHLNRDANLL